MCYNHNNPAIMDDILDEEDILLVLDVLEEQISLL